MNFEDPIPSKMTEDRLDLNTPASRADANRALPALMLASAMGNTKATAYASQILGLAISEALQPSIDALHRLAAYRNGTTGVQ